MIVGENIKFKNQWQGTALVAELIELHQPLAAGFGLPRLTLRRKPFASPSPVLQGEELWADCPSGLRL